MNKIDRMRTVLDGKIADQVPASFWFHFPKENARGKESVKAHLEYYRKVNLDFLKIMNEHPYHVNVDIQHPSDWRRIKPAPLTSDFYQAQLDEIKMITDQLAGECLTATTIFNPFSSGNHASGKKVTEHIKMDPESVSIGLATIAESLAAFSAACLDAGADGIYFSAQGGEADRFEEDEFLEYIKPHDLTVLDAIRDRSDFNILHICRDKIRFEHYIDYPGDIINWAAVAPHNISLAEGYRLFKRTILGGMDNNGLIVNGTPQQIRDRVHEIIADFGPQNLIIGADCTLPTDTNPDHIRAAVEAASSFPGSV